MFVKGLVKGILQSGLGCTEESTERWEMGKDAGSSDCRYPTSLSKGTRIEDPPKSITPFGPVSSLPPSLPPLTPENERGTGRDILTTLDPYGEVESGVVAGGVSRVKVVRKGCEDVGPQLSETRTLGKPLCDTPKGCGTGMDIYYRSNLYG